MGVKTRSRKSPRPAVTDWIADDITATDVNQLRTYLLIAYVLAGLALVAIVLVRGELADWIVPA